MAAALFLSRAGHTVTLIDQFDLPKPVGSGLVIQPVGLDVLSQLGLADKIINYGNPIFKMSGHEAKSGRTVLNVDYGREGGATYGLGIHRASLFDVLYQAVCNEKIHLEQGQDIISHETSNSGNTLKALTSKTFGPYDLIIDASGASSKLSPIKSRALPFGALWGTVDWPENTTLPQGYLSQCYRRANHMLGVLPIGTLPNDSHQKAAIFWSEPVNTLPDWPDKDLNAWKQRTIDLWPEFAPFVSQITQHSDMTPATYRHGTLRTPYGNNIAFIGDSAHQASPQLGQGANMALLDACVLADALTELPIDQALEDYARRRILHVGLYQTFSAVFTPFYQSESQILPLLRDNIMNPLSYIWPVKPLLTRLVCGTLIRP